MAHYKADSTKQCTNGTYFEIKKNKKTHKKRALAIGNNIFKVGYKHHQHSILKAFLHLVL